MTTNSDADVKDRLFLARVGWCKYYNGMLGDEPRAGGTFNDGDVGSEWNNFRIIKGRVYGYVYPTVVLKRVGGPVHDSHKNVAVAFFATNPDTGGQYLVGWQRHISLNDPMAYADRPAGHYGSYLWSCAAADATLLPPALRSLPIPKGKGGTGQAQVTYARDAQGRLKKASWISAIRKFILNYEGPSVTGIAARAASTSLVAENAEDTLRGQGIVTNAVLRKVIEAYAMRRVRALLKKKYGTDPVDTSATESYDFLCKAKGKAIKVEVKGTRSTGESLLFSAAEVALARDESVDLYVVSGVRITGDAKSGFKPSGGEIEHVPNWGRSKFDSSPLAFQITRR